MIGEPLFPNIHTVYDYLYSYDVDCLNPDVSENNTENSQFECLNKSNIERYDDDEQCIKKCSLKASLFHTRREDEDSRNVLTYSIMPFVLTDIEKQTSTRIRIDEELLTFATEDDCNEAFSFLEARNRIAEQAAADGVQESFRIADRLYADGYSYVIAKFAGMLPEVVYTHFDAALALLFYVSVGDRILRSYADISEASVEDSRVFILNSNNQDAYNQMNELFHHLAELIASEESIDPILAGTVAYLMYRKYLIEVYSEVWVEKYGQISTDDISEYIADCVAQNRVATNDMVTLSALTYYLQGLYEPFLTVDYSHALVKVYAMVEAAENDSEKTSFRDYLLS